MWIFTHGLASLICVGLIKEDSQEFIIKMLLDVGAANGYFSFYFESLGAERVVAVDLPRYINHDSPRWYLDKKVATLSSEELEEIDFHELHGGFIVAREILESRVEMRHHRVYDLAEALGERFDFVFCGSLLHHLRDPVLGLESIRDVMNPGAKLILSTPVDLTDPKTSYALFVGEPSLPAWWVPSPEGLKRMCRMAGFSQCEWITSFEITRKKEPKIVDIIGIVHVADSQVSDSVP